MKATLIVGLPGSGKTYLGKTFPYFIDDPKDLPNLELKDVAIADPNFCISSVRDSAIRYLEGLGFQVECLFFENDPQKCLHNVIIRNDGRVVESTIYNLSKLYHIPNDVKILEIFLKK